MSSLNKMCVKCEQSKSLDEFEQLKTGNHRSYCLDCGREKKRAYAEANRERIAENNRRRYLADPEKIKARSRDHYAANRDQHLQNGAARYEANRETIRTKARQDYAENRERILASQREYLNRPEVKAAKKRYRDENRPRLRELRRLYRQDRYANDPVFRVKTLLRGRLKAALVEALSTKKDRTLSLVGCSALEFVHYIESLWHSGMTWGNHGEYWQIDHKEPVCMFNLDDESQQRACFHWSNQQPILTIDHYVKSVEDKRRCQASKTPPL